MRLLIRVNFSSVYPSLAFRILEFLFAIVLYFLSGYPFVYIHFVLIFTCFTSEIYALINVHFKKIRLRIA